MSEIREAISWWEHLSDSTREVYLNGKTWSDIGDNTPEGIDKRHQWLLELFNS